MTVKELIDKLQQFNGDRVVLVEDAEYKIKFGKVLDLFFNGLSMV